MKVIFMITGTDFTGKVHYYSGVNNFFSEQPFNAKVYNSYDVAQGSIKSILENHPHLLIKIEKFFVAENF